MNGWVGRHTQQQAQIRMCGRDGLWWGWMMGDGALAGATVTVVVYPSRFLGSREYITSAHPMHVSM